MLLIAFDEKQSPLQIAYIARYYYPPHSRRISHYNLYLTDLHGDQRVLISSKVARWSAPIWQDRDTVCWKNSDNQWTAYNLVTGRRKKLVKPPKQPSVPWVNLLGEPTAGVLKTGGQTSVYWRYDYRNFRCTLRRSGRSVLIQSYDGMEPRIIAASKKAIQTYVVFSLESANGMDSEQALKLLDWRAGRLKLLRRHVKAFEIYTNRDIFLCYEEADR